MVKFAELSEPEQKLLGLCNVLKELNIRKSGLEASLITLLLYVYDNDERKVLSYLDHLSKRDKELTPIPPRTNSSVKPPKENRPQGTIIIENFHHYNKE
jgi:hypothetical protein